MIKILVAVTDYPRDCGDASLMYIHTRNLQYCKHGIGVTVLNFSCSKGYIIEGVKVISLSEYISDSDAYDELVLHAPNIRRHYIFLKKYEEKFKKIFIFFHGHEILNINKVYPAMYSYLPIRARMARMVHYIYDPIKLFLWQLYLPTIANKTSLIFVSQYLLYLSTCFVVFDGYKLGKNVHIISNGIGSVFETSKYSHHDTKKYNFITIRSRLDSSEHCIDLIVKLAQKNPMYSFLIIGRGEYFSHYDIPTNVTYIPKCLKHDEMVSYINQACCALMLTRHDTQGVMSCELASYGIPLITSDIPVCREVFDDFSNVLFMENKVIDLSSIYNDALKTVGNYSEKYYYSNTTIKEEALLKC